MHTAPSSSLCCLVVFRSQLNSCAMMNGCVLCFIAFLEIKAAMYTVICGWSHENSTFSLMPHDE